MKYLITKLTSLYQIDHQVILFFKTYLDPYIYFKMTTTENFPENVEITNDKVFSFIQSKDKYKITHEILYDRDGMRCCIDGIDVFFTDKNSGKIYVHTSCCESYDDFLDIFNKEFTQDSRLII